MVCKNVHLICFFVFYVRNKAGGEFSLSPIIAEVERIVGTSRADA